ncbi:MAG: hypothetical protein LBG59_08190 [Candidatus Peribacteria bacterium]|nr:hypothetical protein [Candidatus Peribacteria bacterium]
MPPKGTDGTQRIQMEIVDTSADAVKVKFSGGELRLGNMEGKVVTFPKQEEYWTTFLGKFAN